MVLGLDAGVHNDSFAIVGVTRHPDRPDEAAIRYAREYIAPVDLLAVDADLRQARDVLWRQA